MIAILLITIITLVDRSFSGAAILCLIVYSVVRWNDLNLKPILLQLPIILVYFFAVFVGIENISVHYYRDLSFGILLLGAFYMGYQLEKHARDSLAKSIILLVPGVALYHIYLVVTKSSLDNLVEIRSVSSGIGELAVMSIILYNNQLLFGRFSKANARIARVGLFLAAAITVITLSRTVILEIVLLLAMEIWTKSKVVARGMVCLLLVVFFGIILNIDPEIIESQYSFQGKMVRSLSEIVPDEDKDRHADWRAVESAIVLKHIKTQSANKMMFGNGFGATIDLGFPMLLGESVLTELPIFHNGYIYIIFKFGIFGLLIFGFQVFVVSKRTFFRLNGRSRLSFLSTYFIISILVTQVFSSGVVQNSQLLFVVMLGSFTCLNDYGNFSVNSKPIQTGLR
jgi:hypothetical protein